MNAARPLRRIPGALLVAMVLVSMGLREWYPFSYFPMYASFGEESWHVVVTDGADQVLPTTTRLGIDSRPFKRMWEQRMLAEMRAGRPPAEAETRAAEALLRERAAAVQASPGAPPLPDRLRLWMVRSRIAGTRVTDERQMIGDVPVR